MKFTITREDLLPALQQVVGVIERKQTLPILSNVLLKLDEHQLELTGTDLEVQLVTRIAVDADEPGSLTVPARKFLDICRLLPERNLVKIESRQDKFHISCGSSRFNLSTLPAENYPEFDSGMPEVELSIPVMSIRRALEKTMFAVAQQDVRYYLNGLLLDLGGQMLRSVASDGHRLSFFEETLDVHADSPRQIIVPRKGILELNRLLGEGDDTIKMQIAPNNLRVCMGALSFAAKLIEGRFPDYQRVMPRDLSRVIVADKNLFKAALTRVSVLSNEKFRGISLEVDDDGLMCLKAQNPEHEEAEEKFTVDLQGKGMSVGFNASYLLDALNGVDSEQVKLSFPESSNTCLIEDAEDHRFKFVVMPMRL
jgi:DNA polymerase-3 subunit beta